MIDKSQVVQSTNAKSDLTSKVFLGRPWRGKCFPIAEQKPHLQLRCRRLCKVKTFGLFSDLKFIIYRVAFTNTYLSSVINSAGWEQWSSSSPQTDHVSFTEFNNTGALTYRPLYILFTSLLCFRSRRIRNSCLILH